MYLESSVVYTTEYMKRRNNLSPSLLVDLSIPQNVYLLGRLWADGHVGSQKIDLYASTPDIAHLLPFLSQMGIQTIYHRQRLNKDGTPFGKPSVTVTIGSTYLVEYLNALGYKTKSVDSPRLVLKAIDPSLHPLFWRGFFDGDGCLYLGKNQGAGSTKLAFWGTQEQDWSDLTNLYLSLGIEYSLTKYSRKGGKHCSSVIEVRRLASIKRFCDWLYASYGIDQIGLPRKHTNYIALIQRMSTKTTKASPHTGVYYDAQWNKWFSVIGYSKRRGLNKNITCGRFNTEREAHEARQAKLKELNLNDPSPLPPPSGKVYNSNI